MLDQNFQGYRKEHPRDLIFGMVASILLHSILFLTYYWLKSTPEYKRSSPPIPIEFVEVPPNPQQIKPPPQTKRRAANDSVAGGKAIPNRPVAATPQARSKSATSTAVLPRNQKPRLQPRNIAPPISKPKRLTREDLLPPKPASERLATRINPRRPVESPSTSSQAQPRLARSASKSQPRPSPKRTATRTVPNIPSQPSRRSGAARLGGSMSVSSRNFKGNYQAAVPNSNRLNRGGQGIDARRDADIGSYLMQLQQRVRQQWIPGLNQTSRRTVVYFVVGRSGQISRLRVVRPSGSSISDQAALGAVSRAAPFAPLPPGYSENYINIRFTFNINVAGQLELGVR